MSVLKTQMRSGIQCAEYIYEGYLEDLTDADLLVRPLPGCNHIAWQLGHLITSERKMMEAVAPGRMPPLPDGFEARHTKESAASDNPKDFYTKAEYLRCYKEQRAATLKVLEELTEAQLMADAPEAMRSYAARVADVVMMADHHWLMHAGQWAVVRRKLGKPPLY